VVVLREVVKVEVVTAAERAAAVRVARAVRAAS
jgi:hypothetical protein